MVTLITHLQNSVNILQKGNMPNIYSLPRLFDMFLFHQYKLKKSLLEQDLVLHIYNVCIKVDRIHAIHV